MPISPLILWPCAVLIVTNLTAFIMMGVDKRRAVKGRWRTSERALLIACACFGALGGWLGMRHFRHKTKHKKFTVSVPIMLILQIALLVYLAVRFVF